MSAMAVVRNESAPHDDDEHDQDHVEPAKTTTKKKSTPIKKGQSDTKKKKKKRKKKSALFTNKKKRTTTTNIRVPKVHRRRLYRVRCKEKTRLIDEGIMDPTDSMPPINHEQLEKNFPSLLHEDNGELLDSLLSQPSESSVDRSSDHNRRIPPSRRYQANEEEQEEIHEDVDVEEEDEDVDMERAPRSHGKEEQDEDEEEQSDAATGGGSDKQDEAEKPSYCEQRYGRRSTRSQQVNYCDTVRRRKPRKAAKAKKTVAGTKHSKSKPAVSAHSRRPRTRKRKRAAMDHDDDYERDGDGDHEATDHDVVQSLLLLSRLHHSQQNNTETDTATSNSSPSSTRIKSEVAVKSELLDEANLPTLGVLNDGNHNMKQAVKDETEYESKPKRMKLDPALMNIATLGAIDSNHNEQKPAVEKEEEAETESQQFGYANLPKLDEQDIQQLLIQLTCQNLLHQTMIESPVQQNQFALPMPSQTPQLQQHGGTNVYGTMNQINAIHLLPPFPGNASLDMNLNLALPMPPALRSAAASGHNVNNVGLPAIANTHTGGGNSHSNGNGNGEVVGYVPPLVPAALNPINDNAVVANLPNGNYDANQVGNDAATNALLQLLAASIGGTGTGYNV